MMFGLEWIPMILLMLSLYYIGKDKTWGWLLQIAGCISFIGLGIIFNVWGFVIGNTIFGIIASISYKNHKERKRA